MIYDAESRSITTQRLILRPFREEDVPAITAQLNDEAVTRSTHALSYPFTEAAAARWIGSQRSPEEGGSPVFAVTDKATGEMYGFICLVLEPRDHRGEVGYAYGRAHWGKGIASEACKALVDYAFSVLKLHKVYARHFVSNPASGRVMQKAGMVYEGTQLAHDFKQDHYEDVASYGVVRPE